MESCGGVWWKIIVLHILCHLYLALFSISSYCCQLVIITRYGCRVVFLCYMSNHCHFPYMKLFFTPSVIKFNLLFNILYGFFILDFGIDLVDRKDSWKLIINKLYSSATNVDVSYFWSFPQNSSFICVNDLQSYKAVISFKTLLHKYDFHNRVALLLEGNYSNVKETHTLIFFSL